MRRKQTYFPIHSDSNKQTNRETSGRNHSQHKAGEVFTHKHLWESWVKALYIVFVLYNETYNLQSTMKPEEFKSSSSSSFALDLKNQ